MKIHNTLTGQKEVFVPLGDVVKMYVCGVTPYDNSHFGHAMSYVFFDTIRRYLKYRGYKVKYVQNVTDIDDKIINRANQRGVSAAELARKYSEGPTRDSGGYLGTFEREAMVKPFADAAFLMTAGEISEPVRTEFGWHVIKVEKVNEASTLSPGAAKEKIRKQLTEEKSRLLAYEKADAVYETTFDGDDLAQVAAERNLTIKTTDYFTLQQGPEGVRDRSKFAEAAFKLSDMQISGIQEFEDGYYILQLVEKIPEKIPALNDVEAAVRLDAIAEKQSEKAKADAADFLDAVKAGKPFADESRRFDVAVKSTDFFKRNEPIPDIGYEPEIAAAVFSLSEKQPLPDAAVKGSKGYFVFKLRERKEPEVEAFNKEKSELIEYLIRNKRQEALQSWLADVRGRSEITVEKGFLEEG